MSQPDRPDRDEDLSQVLRRFDEEFGQRREDEPIVYGENRPFSPQEVQARAEGQKPNPGEVPPTRQTSMRLSIPLNDRPRAFMVLLIINVIIFVVPAVLDFFVQNQGYRVSDIILALGAKNNAAIKLHGQYYRLLTAMFLHYGWIHIAFNGYALYVIGPQTERVYGTIRFLALYFIAGLCGSVASYAFMSSISVGASGAIFGLIGGLAAFYYVSRRVLGQMAQRQLGSLITVIMLNLFLGFSVPNIDYTAHIGGLIGGLLVGWLLAPRFEIDQRLYPPVVVRRSLPLAWGWTLGVLGLLVVLVMVVNPPF